MDYYARPASEQGGPAQLLRDHLQQVARRAEEFAVEIGLPPDMARWAGLLHDLGKYSHEFQKHRIGDGDRRRVEHACHGACVAQQGGAEQIAFAVAAHHAGLHNLKAIKELLTRGESMAEGEAKVLDRAASFLSLARADSAFDGVPPADQKMIAPVEKELRIRMLLSCLADADRLDAEAWANPDKREMRDSIPRLEPAERLRRVLDYTGTVAAAKRDTSGQARVVNDVRAEVLAACVGKADLAPGFFSLTVPTGGGKTLSSLAFALAHAKTYAMRRVILVVPYLSIIEQNAEVIRKAVGDVESDTVLEHHSQAGTEDQDEDCQSLEEVRRRLLAENWEAPIVVTTTVQFFESLFSDKPGKLRKVHNIPRSVVLFDEAQTFPPELLKPLMAMLEQLVTPYGCSVVFCTATQPAFSHPLGPEQKKLLTGEVREIAPEPVRLFQRLKRVEVDWSRALTAVPVEEIASEMVTSRQALTIVNTKQQALELYQALRDQHDGAVHLSTRMCPAHRLATLDEIRIRLRAGDPCLVAATQLVEAGVDLDFGGVWRAFAGLDSIAQAAGRCNREGLSNGLGKVTVFGTWDDKMPGGAYRTAATVTKGMVEAAGEPLDIHDPDAFTGFFRRFYNRSPLDKKNVAAARTSLSFPEVAARVRLIDDDTTPVLVPYGRGAEFAARLRSGEPIALYELRQMSPFMVSLYSAELRNAKKSAFLEQTDQGIWLYTGAYDGAVGLTFRDDVFIG